MRLIDTDTLVKGLSYLYTKNHIPVDMRAKEILTTIMEQPTAYDPDKVVEELEERTDFLKDCTKYGNKNAKQQDKSYSTMMMYEVADLVDDLIEIVKHGGVNDNVCEWKMDNVGASIGCRSDLHHTGYVNRAYCPYCGKKIKVVE